ncbi:hypothetical protein [Streptacidiphilus sp. EB129]|uniref:hypothetical protein n=1 Tax=Streptacidiphilus sp. EB129 TaxID=3156262 RepID=UPI003517B913
MTGVVFTVLATAAPIAAMTGNVPIAIARGAGRWGAPHAMASRRSHTCTTVVALS